MADEFNAEQKRYLEGFASGISAARMTGGLVAGQGAAPPAEPIGPDAIHIKAQDATIKAGGKLCEQEKWKRAENPFDGHNRLVAEAAAGKTPKPEDNFRWRYHGLFWLAGASPNRP
jgi:ferredoxin-nitrite reductase